MSHPVVRLTGVTKDYQSESITTRVLHGVDLTLEHGEFAALMGPSGCGKSTLLNIMGLLDKATTGTLELNGVETTSLHERERTALRGRDLGFIFQFHHLLPAFTALENAMMPLMADAGRPTPQMREQAMAMLDEVGMAGFAKRNARQLSGGQQQRVAIARAMARRPPLVLADEPTGNLDSKTSAQAFEFMRKLNTLHGAAFLIVTHDARIAQRCDRVIEMVDGRIQSDTAATQ